MHNTKIEWCHHTHNPWWGCARISPGCDKCYAADKDQRFYAGEHWGKDAPRRFPSEAYWREPLKWNRAAELAGERHRVFLGSMCDIMEDRRDLDAPRQRDYDLIERTPWLDWLLLTKRPQNFRRLLPPRWLKEPRKSVWLLTTVESQEYLWRIEELVKVPGHDSRRER